MNKCLAWIADRLAAANPIALLVAGVLGLLAAVVVVGACAVGAEWVAS